jgi:hypothetical protein
MFYLVGVTICDRFTDLPPIPLPSSHSSNLPERVTDGVVLIDPEYVKDRKVFGHVLAAFRYGREDLDVLGLTFRKDLYLAAEQVTIPF